MLVPMPAHVLTFDNRLRQSLPGDPETGPGARQVHGAAWSAVAPTPVAAPRLLAWTPALAEDLGFSPGQVLAPCFAEVFAGNALLPGMAPWAANYGGHQFGHWAGQLGDGRAISLGETIGRSGQRHELQLKGAGPTPYSRHADGRAVLRSSIREFICSEAMHHLGVPTTRVLSLVATGEPVTRDMFYDGHPRDEPGAVVCRVAPSFIRFGTFELPAARGDIPLLRQLVAFCIARDFPELDGQGEHLYGDWFSAICARTAVLVAHWMRVGFVHGVMNTDNMSITGLTLDYGPYGWVEDYDPDFTPNTTDAQGRRYRFGWQPRMAHWNLARLAQALSPLFGDAAPLQAGLAHYAEVFTRADRAHSAAKLGLDQWREGDDALIGTLHSLMVQVQADMTLWFRLLSAHPARELTPALFAPVCYRPDALQGVSPALADWLARYAARQAADGADEATRRARMAHANPLYVPRNWLLQQAIAQAEDGDLAGVQALARVLRQPCVPQPGAEAFAAMRPDWAAGPAGGAMLSCSS